MTPDEMNDYFARQEEEHKKMKIQCEDVWGAPGERGKMIVANHNEGGFNKDKCESKGKCPIFGDHIDYKSATIVCEYADFDEVMYWVSYVQGGDPSMTEVLPNGKVALRSDYHAW